MLIMRLDGHTYQEVADKAGVSRQRVQQILSPPPLVRNLVYERADRRCQSCGVLVGKSGHVHHTGNNDGEEDYNDADNLQLLCLSCHRGAHIGEYQDRNRERKRRARYSPRIRGENQRVCPDCGGTHLWGKGISHAEFEPDPPRSRYVCVNCACVFLVRNKSGDLTR